MTVLTRLTKSLVIQGYLNGKSRDIIAQETGISLGSASNAIKEWKIQIGSLEAEEIREFAVLVKKSGISMEQCTQGFRMVQLLKKLGIEEKIEDENDQFIKDVISFIEIIYKQCKKLDVSPIIVPSWIKDLLDCYSNNADSIEKETKTFPNSNSNHSLNKISSHTNTEQPSSPSSSTSPIEFEIPYISQISDIITQKRKKCIQLKNYKLDLDDDINSLKLQKDNLNNSLNQIIQNENFVMTYLDWYYDLKKELEDTYDINIEQDIQDFAKLISDFKKYGYEAIEIINEYNRVLSIRLEIETKEAEIKTIQNQKTILNNSVLFLESQANMHKQTLDIYSRLEPMKFGIKELQQLWLTILEIAKANNIPNDQAVFKFLKDIDEQYNRKLGLEGKVNEKRDELHKINIELTNSRQKLFLDPFVGSALYSLFQNGVSEPDIIGINQLALEFIHGNFHYHGNFEGKDNKEKENNTGKSRAEFWKSLIAEFKEYGGIQLAIKNQSEKLEKIKQEFNQINNQKQEFLGYCNLANSFLNEISNKISYCKGVIDYLNKEIYALSPLTIFVININSDRDKNEEK